MEERLLAATVVGIADLQRLADARSVTLKHQLVDVRGLPETRVFIRGAAVGANASKDQVICKLDLDE